MNLFEGLQNFFLGKNEDKKEFEQKNGPESFAQPVGLDGEVVIAGGLVKSAIMETANSSKNDRDLIGIYRQIAKIPEINEAIDEIVNEMLSKDDTNQAIRLNLQEIELPEKIKDAIHEELKNILHIMDFAERGHEYIKRWYIDGRIAFHKIVDRNNLKSGIRGLRYINPLSIEKIIEYEKVRDNGVDLYKTTKQYYRYTPGNRTNSISIKGDEKNNGSSMSFSNNFWANSDTEIFGNNQILAISPEAVAWATSGQYDEDFGCVLSYLHPVIKVANNLSIMEDSQVIYNMTRAPERRVFYVDVGNLPKTKGEQYMNELMSKFKSILTYDSATGQVKDGRRFQSMMEDFWIPRRENGRATEISTLPGGQGLSMDPVEYFLKKLYSALKIPASRFNKDQPIIAGIGRSSEITRDELRFQKFIDRLRNKFAVVFEDILGTQLVLKKIMEKSEWEDIRRDLQWEWARDSFFTEMKNSELLRERLQTLQMADNYIGKYFTTDYVLKSILQVPDEELDQLKKDLENEQQQSAEDEQNQAYADAEMKNDLEASRLEKILPIQQKFEDKEENDE